MLNKNVNITNEDESSKVGRHEQDQIKKLLIRYYAERGKVCELRDPVEYAKLDWVLFLDNVMIGFVECKKRTNGASAYNWETYMPIHKVKLAYRIRKEMGFHSYSVIYFQGDNSFYMFNLLEYIRREEKTRWDRGTVNEYAFYDVRKAQKLGVLNDGRIKEE